MPKPVHTSCPRLGEHPCGTTFHPHRPRQRHHRLDRARERPRTAPRAGEAHPPQARLSAQPDMQEKATQTVLEQAEVLSEGWAVA